MCPEILNILEIHGVPLTGVWTVVDVNGTHVEVFLVTAGPDALDLEIELGESASGDFMVEVAQQVELFLVPQEGALDCFLDVVEEDAI